MEVLLKQNENLKVVEEEHEQLKIAFAEQSQRLVGRFTSSFYEETIFSVYYGSPPFSLNLSFTRQFHFQSKDRGSKFMFKTLVTTSLRRK